MTAGSSKAPKRSACRRLRHQLEQGFILTPYFYDALIKFEKDPAGLSHAYGDLVSGIDVGKERKRAAPGDICFRFRY